jgi:hypothetical protein
MYDVSFLKGLVKKADAQNAIFDACRANDSREPRNVGRFTVTFSLLSSGDYGVAVRDLSGMVVALAKVDKFDC